MPDAYENLNMAMRSMLTTNNTVDNEEPLFSLNDLAPMDVTLSPYSSSASQGNISITSPMSTSSSPGYSANYITLNAAVLGEPYITILVQPMEKFRFRYKSEMVGTHGSLFGISDRLSRRKTVPTVKLNNFPEEAVIRCTLVTTDEDHRIPHAHKLVRREGSTDQDDSKGGIYIEVSPKNDFTASFHNMGIIHTARKYIREELIRKMYIEILEERKRKNINATLSLRDDAEIKSNAERSQKFINLNSVALCFQGFIANNYDVMIPITTPVYSTPINNLKSALTGELKICRIDKYISSCEGGEEIFILVEKVGKKNIKIKFFELNDDDQEIWVDYGRFSELDVHHQYAIVFRTPPYKDQSITSSKEVFIQLERPSDSDCSEPIKFTYKPSDRMIGRKRMRKSSSSSTELSQMALQQSVSSTDIHISNNESIEISKELKKILDNDRCSSSEFRDFVEHLDLDMYVNLLSNSEENKLTYDGPTKKENDKWFAKNIVSEVLKRLKTEPDKAKEVIRDLLKDRSIYGDSPLHCALRYEQKDIIKYILMLMGVIPDSKHLVNIQNSSGKTPLHYAAAQNQSEITKALLILGANPNAYDHCGETPLHNAVRFPEAGPCVDILLCEKDLNIESHTDLGWTPLQLAAEAGSCDAVRSLIQAGANVNNTDMSYGRTALHIAVEGGHKDIVEFLLKKTKIDVNKRNFSGNTALHTAVVTPGTKAKEICSFLLKYGADPTIRNHNWEPSIMREQNGQIIKTEIDMDLDNENMEEYTNGQSSIDLASNKPDILELVSGQTDIIEKDEEKIFIKQEVDNDVPLRVWLDKEQEIQLSAILDKTQGWKKLGDHFNFGHLLKVFEQSPSSPTLLLLNYIDVQAAASLSKLQNVLQDIGEVAAATYVEEILH